MTVIIFWTRFSPVSGSLFLGLVLFGIWVTTGTINLQKSRIPNRMTLLNWMFGVFRDYFLELFFAVSKDKTYYKLKI